jgi:hypothetical protein
MGLSPAGSTDTVWVAGSTYAPIFSSIKVPNDPSILLVNGIIYEDGTVDTPLAWYSLPAGTPDTMQPTGRFGIRFTTGTGTTETRFAAQFYMNVDPGIAVGEDLPDTFEGFGAIPINFAGFAFAVAYPPGTTKIEIVDHKLPAGSDVIKTIDPSNVKTASSYFGGFLPPINTDGTSKFKAGSTVPVKFRLTGPQGQIITNAVVTLSFIQLTSTILGTDVEASTNLAVTAGNLFRYDPTSNQYIFNLSTKSLSKGTYLIKATFEDGITKTVQISLK